jgi:hypothetical protein
MKTAGRIMGLGDAAVVIAPARTKLFGFGT